MSCPCGSGAAYDACCGRFHAGECPQTPEQLMRSRYTAFVKADWPYLAKTQLAPLGAVGPLQWVGLTVHVAEGDEVEFTARYVDGEREIALRERSRFERRDGRGVYASGATSVSTQKLSRNAPCPCGSGKKLKACHGQ